MAVGRSCRTEGTCSGSLRSREEAVIRGLVEAWRVGRDERHGQLLTMVTHVVPQQPLRGKSLGTVRALEVLLCGGAGRREGGL